MVKKIKTVIIDDEPLARKGLSIRLQEYPELDVIGEANNGQNAFELIKAMKPDLVFMDIQMPVMNGFQVLSALEQNGIPLPIVIFVTAYDQYAIQAFDVHALDYLLKPVEDSRLKEAVDKVNSYLMDKEDVKHKQKLVGLMSEFTGDDCESILRRLATGEVVNSNRFSEFLSIKDGGEVTRVRIKSIFWIDAAGDYMCVHSSDGQTHIMRKTMKELEQELDPRIFIRIHRSVIVNKSQIRKLVTHSNGEYHVVLESGKELKVSRSYKEKVKSLMN